MKRLIIILAVVASMTARAQNQEPEPVLSPTLYTATVNEHSAKKALLLSLMPGGGQIYNRQAWKLPIIYGAFAGMGYLIYHNHDRMTLFRDEYLYRIQHDGTPQLEEYSNLPIANIYNQYQSYNKNFQLMIIITAGIYGLNLIDAYVFGHLFDFQINDNLTMSVTPQMATSLDGLTFAPTLGVRLTF